MNTNSIHVKNITGNSGNEVKNQFIIIIDTPKGWVELFQSYKSIIVRKNEDGSIVLDKDTWDYSKITSKYRSLFLHETTAETKAKIKSGVYTLDNLNK